jgi:hypothetical protein
MTITVTPLKTTEDLLGRFNFWVERRQFVTIDETHTGDNRQQINKLKALITGQYNKVDIKFKPEYMIRDRVNYLFMSQYADALHLDKKDRRFMIIHANESKPPPALIKRVGDWKRSGNAAAILFRILLNYRINRAVKPHGEAPVTPAKRDMQRASQTSLPRVLRQNHGNEICTT